MQPIPEEILLKIFHQVDQMELVSMSEVSPDWARISRDSSLWQNVSLTFRRTLPCQIQDVGNFVERLIGKSLNLVE